MSTRKLSQYNLFVQKHRRAGYSMAQCGALWRQHKHKSQKGRGGFDIGSLLSELNSAVIQPIVANGTSTNQSYIGDPQEEYHVQPTYQPQYEPQYQLDNDIYRTDGADSQVLEQVMKMAKKKKKKVNNDIHRTHYYQ